jgi:ATP-dependent Clp protease ATP-binding subunit ClpA
VLEKFSTDARHVVVQAGEAARALNHESIDTGHLLLGLIAQAQSLAAQVLERLHVTERSATAELVRMNPRSENPSADALPFESDAKEVLESALEEAMRFASSKIMPEHILLALLRSPGSTAARVLAANNVNPASVRSELMRISTRRFALLSEIHRPAFGVWDEVRPTDALRRVLIAAAELAIDCGRLKIDVDDVLLTIVADRTVAPLLAELGIQLESVDGVIARYPAQRRATDPGREN